MDQTFDSDTASQALEGVQPPENRGDQSIRAACSEVVKKMASLGLTLDKFLDALCYGDESCRDVPELKTARQAPGAAEPLEAWALATAEEIYRRELLEFAQGMKCYVEEIVNEETLSELTFQSILDQVTEHAPRLFKLLSSLCEGKRRGGQGRTGKDTTFVSQINNRTQMFFAVYLKAKGAPKSIFTLLQQCGRSLSYNWAQNAIKSISKEAMLKVITMFEEHPCFFLYDNLRFPFDVEHRTSDNVSVTDNGTAITVIPIEDEAARILNDPESFLEHVRSIKKKYIDDRMEFLTPNDLHQLDENARVNKRLRYNPLEPIEALPHGLEHRSKQFMLGTVNIEEASLAGNHSVMEETLRQLNITTPAQQRDLVESRIQVWLGDQLTVSRGEGLTEVKQPQLNTFERNGWTHREPGRFHILMNLAKSIYYTDYGTSTGICKGHWAPEYSRVSRVPRVT